ncbi:thiol reductant ABC exporter subunit CydC [Chlorobium phaeobacteroides]|uniref:ABC transporter, transmembrane region, type 1 n=1 Tax=Chlorobium phaeobacteroides (strain DSM 266 / SMG 266 / 2430) TaxID=290317 RepID=A1BEC5_CHLPD|nr:thiol reductant ABC exporter subunit CydC [Chlorobium phaeobacteroides]ABL64752.1 ABC transporter, transmembrane region, type 1 [Chlorobium phaeobacteroides DSM 266]
MKTFFRLVALVKPYLWWMALAAFIGFATTGSGIGLLMTSAYIIAKAALQPPMVALQVGIAGVRFFGLARGAFRYAERLISHNITFKILAKLRLWFYDAIEPLAPARLMHFKSGDLLQRVVDDIQSLENIYTRVLGPPLTALLVTALMWFLLGSYSVSAAMIILCFHTLAGIGVPILTMQLSRGISVGIMKHKAEEQVLALDLIQGIGELQLYGNLPAHLAAMQSAETGKLQLQRKNAVIEGLHESLTGLLMNGAVITILWTLIPSISSGATANGIALSVITLAVMASFEPFLPLPSTIKHIEADQHAGERLFEILDAKPETIAPANPIPFPSEHAIQVKRLSFTYPGSTAKALDSLSFSVLPGEHIAIVGPSGAGKSTITALFMRFWNSREGCINIGGHNITLFDPEELRRNIALVSQKTYLFAETIRENLTLAAPGATDDDLKKALTAAGLSHFASKLDEWCGQHGMKLSGGERQRIAIARILLQRAPIMILDEATANLDGITEKEVTETLTAISAGKTLITITHRLKAMEKYHRIFVLEKGKIVEQGVHSELMAGNGLYRRMWELQHMTELG